MYDSCQNTLDADGDVATSNNTYNNYKTGKISENKNSRKCVLEAQYTDEKEGIGEKIAYNR